MSIFADAVCPITMGRKTKMTEESFVRTCAHNRTVGATPTIGSFLPQVQKICLQCNGEHQPPELTFITLADATQEKDMAQKTTNPCELCGKTTSRRLEKSRGLDTCSTCRMTLAVAANRPELFVAAAEHVGQREALAELLGVGWSEQGMAMRSIEKSLGMPEMSDPEQVALAAAQVAAQLEDSEGALAAADEERQRIMQGLEHYHEQDLASMQSRLDAAIQRNEDLERQLTQLNGSTVDLLDPSRDTLIKFALAVIRGDVVVAHADGWQ